METEDKEVLIVRKVYASPYAHAENVLLRLYQLEREMPHDEAIEVLFLEVMEEGAMPNVLYCATCRVEFETDEDLPPYGVVHVVGDPVVHVHPITRKEVTQVREPAV